VSIDTIHLSAAKVFGWKYDGSTMNPGSVYIITREQPRDRRFQLRATAFEETMIKVAAERQGVNVTDFIIRSACEKAEQALGDQRQFLLNDKQWKLFMEALDGPPREKLRLRRLFSEKQVAKRRS
jgi:uncharacterized protein (DUF1778 family)